MLASLAPGASQPASAFDLSRFIPAVAGAGPVVHDVQELERFDALRVNSDARVLVRQGDRQAVEVHGEANVVALIKTRVENGSLVVEDARRFTSSAAEVVVTMRRLSAIAASGSSAVVAEGLRGRALMLALGGSSVIKLSGAALDSLQAPLGGSSVLKASGVVRELTLETGDSAVAQAEQLQATSGTVT